MKLWTEIARQTPLVARQLRRNPRRTALTFLGLVIAFFLFTSLESLLYTMSHIVSDASRDALLFVRPDDPNYWRPQLPSSYAESIEDLPGVLAASPVRLYFGSGREEGSFAVAMGIEPDAHLKMGIPGGTSGSELRAFLSSRDAALVGQRLLEDNEWKVGDTVTIRSRGGRTPALSFVIRGDIARGDRLDRVAVVRLDYLEEVAGGAGRVTYVQVRARDAGIASAVADAIDRRFANHTMPTETVTEKAHLAPFIASLSDARDGLRIVGYLALAVTLLVVANSIAIGVRERTREIGTLRAVGYGRARVVGLVLSEAMLVAVAGGTLGALFAWGVFATGRIEIPGAGFAYGTDVSVIVRSALLSVPMGLLAGAQPAWSAVRMTISDALRYSE